MQLHGIGLSPTGTQICQLHCMKELPDQDQRCWGKCSDRTHRGTASTWFCLQWYASVGTLRMCITQQVSPRRTPPERSCELHKRNVPTAFSLPVFYSSTCCGEGRSRILMELMNCLYSILLQSTTMPVDGRFVHSIVFVVTPNFLLPFPTYTSLE